MSTELAKKIVFRILPAPLRKTLKDSFQKVGFKLHLMNSENLRIILGSGGTFQNGWVSTDKKILNLLDEKSWSKALKTKEIHALLAEHVWEHLTLEEGQAAAQICYKFLRKGGHLRVAVPDGYFPDPDYINDVKPNGTGSGAEDHKVLYNYKSFNEIFRNAGFKTILLEYFDENKEFHQMSWEPHDGKISRSLKFDSRNSDGKINYTSIILDAYKE